MSEITAVMVGGFGTIAGGVMAGLVAMGVNPVYVITASFMAAPASLMIAKILYPETEESKTARELKAQMEIPTTNGIEAAAKGASDGLQLSLNVGAMLIAFIALVKLIDSVIGWADYMIDYKVIDYTIYYQLKTVIGGEVLFPMVDEILVGSFRMIISGLFKADILLPTGEYSGVVPGSLKTILSTILWPLAWLMGVPYKDCMNFSYLLGMKISLNEFFAYMEMVKVKNILSPDVEIAMNYGGGVFASVMQESEFLDAKAEAMATFALCGFANFSSIAIQIGGLTPMVSLDQQDTFRGKLSRLGLRAMFGGALVSCMTATIAGFLL
jgi:CNT family concentrative nucleoside transporter